MSTRRRAAERRRRKQRNLFVAAIATVLAGAAAVAIALGHGGRTATAAPQTRPVTVTGASLPAFAAGTTDPAVGGAIPSLSGTGFDGRAVRVTDDGKPKVLLFVAHWCPHCRREVPLLAADLRAHPLPAKVEMITISTGVNAAAPNYPPSQWLAGVHWPTTVMADDAASSAAAAFGLPGYPYFVFVDSHNRVVARASGEMPVTEFRAHVAALT